MASSHPIAVPLRRIDPMPGRSAHRHDVDTGADLLLPPRTSWARQGVARSKPLNDATAPGQLGYREIATVLQDSIRYGGYKVGDRLPTEEALAVEFAVSRLTVRRALDLLSASSLVDRRPRRGTIVRRVPALAVTVSSLNRYAAIAKSIRTRFLGRAGGDADPTLARLFDVAPGSPVAELLFLRLRGETPIASVTMLFPDWAARALPPAPIDDARQINRALADAGIGLATLRQAIGAQNAGPELAQRIGIMPGAAVLRITRDKVTAEQRVFQRMVSHFRADLYEYDTEFIDGDDVDPGRPDP